MSAIHDVDAMLTRDWQKASAIWKRMGKWSVITVRNCLRALTEEGVAERMGLEMNYVYRRRRTE